MQQDTPVTRIFDIPQHQLTHYHLPAAFTTKHRGAWQALSTHDYLAQANQLSRGLLRLGVQPHDKIAVISSTNRWEWNVCDIGVLQVGAQNVPLYPSISQEDYAYILNHSEATYCLVSDETVLAKVNQIRHQTALKGVYTFDTIAGEQHWQEIMALGRDASTQAEVEARKSQITAHHVATIIYTSGTTGKPKGVMLSHHNLVSNVLALGKRLPLKPGQDQALSFLPLCHVFERMVIYLYQYAGLSVVYAESQEKLLENINTFQPQIMTSVPRLYEKIYDRILTRGQALTGLKQRLFRWALALGLRYQPYGANGRWYQVQLALARKLIFSKWRAALGGHMKIMVSGGAALEPQLLRIFAAAGLPIMEGYGLTETSPVIAVNALEDRGFNIGTVGRVIEHVAVKIAADGEVLVKGPNVMQGYFKDPEKTQAVMTEGYFHTGDIGQVDAHGFLAITGRKKEIFKTSGGKYVAPTKLENLLKQSAYVEQAMVVGEGEKMPAVLLQPNFEALTAWAQSQGLSFRTHQELVQHPRVREHIQAEINHVNTTLGSWEQIKTFALTADEWTIAGGQLTPKMSMKRQAILARYAHLYRGLYA